MVSSSWSGGGGGEASSYAVTKNILDMTIISTKNIKLL